MTFNNKYMENDGYEEVVNLKRGESAVVRPLSIPYLYTSEVEVGVGCRPREIHTGPMSDDYSKDFRLSVRRPLLETLSHYLVGPEKPICNTHSHKLACITRDFGKLDKKQPRKDPKSRHKIATIYNTAEINARTSLQKESY